MFENYPKVRPPLPVEYREAINQWYKKNRQGQSPASSLSQRMERWMHYRVAADVQQNQAPLTTLEIGAGTLNHLPFEPSPHIYDIIEPFRMFFEQSPWLKQIHHIYDDIREIPSGHQYDRIISIAVLEHLCDLPEVVARSGLLLTSKGCFRAAIPSEGTILWKLGYTCTTGIEFRKRYGLNYDVFMRHEHVNSAQEITDVVRYFFKSVQRKVFGLHPWLSVYQFFNCASPNIERCQAYLAQIQGARASTSDVK